MVAVVAAVGWSVRDDASVPDDRQHKAEQVAYITGYTLADNTPAWSAAISDPVVHSEAGGRGTYDDPVTLAVAKGALRPGTRIYLPHVKRYFIVEDTCASCGQKAVWLDMWIGGTHDDSSAVQDRCARALTGYFPYEVDPPRGRDVVSGPLLDWDRNCYKLPQSWKDWRPGEGR